MDNFNFSAFLKHPAFWSFFILLAGWVFFFSPVLGSLIREDTRPWVFLTTIGIVLTTLYLVFSRRRLLAHTLLTSSQIGIASLFLLIIIFITATVLNIDVLEQTIVFFMLPFIVMVSFGWRVARILLFPLAYLMLIIPLYHVDFGHRTTILEITIAFFILSLRYLKMYKSDAIMAPMLPVWTLQNSRWLVPTVVVFALFMVSPWLGENIRSFIPIPNATIVLRAPLGDQGWQGPYVVKEKAWEPVFPNASAHLQVEYFKNQVGEENKIYLYSAYYASDRRFDDLLNSKNSIFDVDIWTLTHQEGKTVDLGLGTINVNEEVLQAGANSRLVWYWYYVAGVSTTDLNWAELLDKVRIISKYSQGSGVLILSTAINEKSPDEARKRLTEFLTAMYPFLDVLKRPETTSTSSRLKFEFNQTQPGI